MIRLEKLAFSIGSTDIRADLNIEKGQICALIGPSGAGKSSILNILAGFLPHDQGTVFLNGEDMAGKSPAERPVSMLFQDHNLFPHLSVSDNIGLGLSPSLRLTLKDHDQIRDALQAVGLEEHGTKKPRALSGGERQRVGLARALLRDKPVLLLDEPFAALGPALRQEMMALVTHLARNRGLTILMVTHHPDDARTASDITAFMENGHLNNAQDTSAFFASPSAELRQYLGN